MAAVVILDLLRCSRAARQASCKLTYISAAQLLLIIAWAWSECLSIQAALCRSGGSFSNTANVGARPRSQTEQQMERTASGKTNVIPYSQYRKSRLDSIRNDLGLQGGTLLPAGASFARSLCGHRAFPCTAESTADICFGVWMSGRFCTVCKMKGQQKLCVCRGSRTKGEGKRSR